MSIDRNHSMLAAISGDFHIDVLSSPQITEWIDRSLKTHGRDCERKMPLRSRFVFWLVILLVMKRDTSIPNVFSMLVGLCRMREEGLSYKAITDGGLARARQRLGSGPLRTFFDLSVQEHPRPLWFHDMRPVAADGVRLTMPDTASNCERFSRQRSAHGQVAWPQMLAICLLDIADRCMVGATFDGLHIGERALAQRLWASLKPSDLLIEDKGFFKKEDLWRLDKANRRFLCKVPAHAKFKVLKAYGAGDCLVEICGRRPREENEAPDCPVGRPGRLKKFKCRLRMIVYRINGVEHRLLTNVFNHEISAEEFTRVYHWRWDAEIAYDELKVHLMTVHHGKAHTVFRSKSPALVEQEFWAMLIAYNLVRGLMNQAARQHDLDPLKLSFTDSLRVIQDATLPIQTAPTIKLPQLHKRLMSDLAECLLDRPRRPRLCPRAVKTRASRFPVKNETDHEQILRLKIELPPKRKAAS